jgi:DNA-directed RNA polymerase specialized sigma24 family protein
MSYSNDNAEPLKLHTHHDLAADGAPRMTKAMERYIARPQARVEPSDSEDVRLDDLQQEHREAALTRLQVEHARLYGVLFLTDLRGLSLRATGRCLGMDHHTVTKHRGRAIALIRAWSTDELQAG